MSVRGSANWHGNVLSDLRLFELSRLFPFACRGSFPLARLLAFLVMRINPKVTNHAAFYGRLPWNITGCRHISWRWRCFGNGCHYPKSVLSSTQTLTSYHPPYPADSFDDINTDLSHDDFSIEHLINQCIRLIHLRYAERQCSLWRPCAFLVSFFFAQSSFWFWILHWLTICIIQRLSPTSTPLSTPLYAFPSSIEFATRIAKITAKRTKKPTYVGCSVSFEGATVEEEMEATQVAIDAVLDGLIFEEQTAPVVNGVHWVSQSFVRSRVRLWFYLWSQFRWIPY